MAFIKGPDISGRARTKYGIDFTTADQLGGASEIVFANGMFLDGQTATEVSICNTSGVAVFTIDQDGTISFGAQELMFNDGQGILDSNGAELLVFGVTASAVNELKVTNAATGNPVTISATGGDTNIGMTLTPKGTGDLTLTSGSFVFGADAEGFYDASGNELLVFTKAASAVNYLGMTNSATGLGLSITATGSDTNIDLDISAKGSGVLAVGGLEELLTVGLMGTVALDSFPHNVIVLTEAASTFCKIDDGTDFQDVATSSSGAAITANYQLAPDTAAEDDAVYFGAAAVFGAIYMDMSATNQTYGADSVTWEYWDGSAWSALTIIYDVTDATAQDGLRPFQNDGYIIFSAPTDWASTTVDSQAAYWIRARYNATVNVTQCGLTNSKEHQIPSATTASEVPAAGTLGRARISYGTVSAANNDSIITLCNLTSGACSALKTLTKALVCNEVADFALPVSKGDAIAVYYAVEDGTTEFANGIMEVMLKRS